MIRVVLLLPSLLNTCLALYLFELTSQVYFLTEWGNHVVIASTVLSLYFGECPSASRPRLLKFAAVATEIALPL